MNIAIVTGASSGLGQEFVRQIDNCHFDEIWVIARRRDCLEALQSHVKTHLFILCLDLTKNASLQTLQNILQEKQPNVRLLINAAGFGKIGAWKDISLNDNTRMIDLNCRASVALTQLSLPYMKKGARIMQICSTAAFQPFPYLSVYAASKAFLYRYSRALRVELIPKGISVTAVCPYWIKDTEFIGNAQKTLNSSYIRSFPFASREKTVVRFALSDTKKRFAVSTPGPICAMHRLITKVIPDGLLMAGWELLRRL